jgi:hypothetical protein
VEFINGESVAWVQLIKQNLVFLLPSRDLISLSNHSYCSTPPLSDIAQLTSRMSHYDVVPAPNSTADRWTHPAFSGFNDGKYIWGRGAADDKTLLVAQCMSLNELR